MTDLPLPDTGMRREPRPYRHWHTSEIRTAVQLREVEGCAYSEIAALLGRPKSSVHAIYAANRRTEA